MADPGADLGVHPDRGAPAFARRLWTGQHGLGLSWPGYHCKRLGIGAAVITLRDLSQEQLAQLNTVAVALGLGGFAVSVVAAAPLARFFRSPQLPAVVIILSLAFVVTAFKSVPTSLLQRELRFKEISVIDGVRAIVLAVATVFFAAIGLRYWTLVLGGLLSAVVSTILTLIVRRCNFRRPRWEPLRHALTISWHIL